MTESVSKFLIGHSHFLPDSLEFLYVHNHLLNMLQALLADILIVLEICSLMFSD